MERTKKFSAATKSLGKRGPYLRLTGDKKAVIGKYAAEHGIVAAVRHFSKEFPDSKLKETTVHGWKVKYLSELQKCKSEGGELVVKKLPVAKMGRPLLLGEDLDKAVQHYVFALRDLGGVVNTRIVRAAAAGMVKRKVSSKWRSHNFVQRLGSLFSPKDWFCEAERDHQGSSTSRKF